MKKFFKIVVILLLLPIIVIVGAITYLKFADLNPYKPEIEKLLQKYANIDVKINGDLDVGISLKPSVELNDVVVSVPQNKDINAHIGKALVQISILPLLHKEIVVDLIETDNTEIFYTPKDSVFIKDLDISMESYDTPINIVFDTDVSGINITGKASVSALKELQDANFNETKLLVTEARAMGYTIGFNGWIHGLQTGITAEGDYNIDYRSTKISGHTDVNLTEKIPYIKLKAQSDSINVSDFTAKNNARNNWFVSSAQAAEKINIDIPYQYFKIVNAEADFDIKKIVVQSNRILKNVKGKVSIIDGILKANINNLDYDGNKAPAEAKLVEKRLPDVKLKISGDGFDLTQFTEVKKAESGLFIKNAYASQLIENIEIPYEYLKIANASLDVNLKKITVTPDIALSDIKSDIALNGGILNVNLKNITAGDGKISGKITLNSQNKTLATDLTGDSIILQNLYKPYSNSDNPQMYVKSGGKINFLLKTNTSGSNTDQYLSNMNGQIIAFIDESVLKIKSLERLQGNIIVQVLNALKISDMTKKDTNLSCAVVRADIKDGMSTFPKGIVFNATDFYLVANGTLNLKNDKLNIDLQPFSGKLDSTNISSILGSLLKLTGTINNPKININQASAAKNVVGFLASGGTYNVGDMFLSTDSVPCHTALKGTVYAEYFKGDNSVKAGVSKGYNNVKDGVKDVGKNIKDTGKEIKNQVKDLGNQLKGLFGK